MKKTGFIISMLWLLLSGTAQAADVSTVIADALEKGDAAKLSSLLDGQVEMVIDERNSIFTKQQATSLLTGFFQKHRVKRFDTLHKGKTEAACFLIGTLQTADGTFRVSVLTRRDNDKDMIQQLRIEPSND